VALYRAGQYTEAISVLEQSLIAGKGAFDAVDLFFLTMTHQRLGHPSQARVCFDRAGRWCGEHKNLPAQYVSELTAFRAEAEEVLARARRSRWLTELGKNGPTALLHHADEAVYRAKRSGRNAVFILESSTAEQTLAAVAATR
jgi:hypothetical protein